MYRIWFFSVVILQYQDGTWVYAVLDHKTGCSQAAMFALDDDDYAFFAAYHQKVSKFMYVCIYTRVYVSMYVCMYGQHYHVAGLRHSWITPGGYISSPVQTHQEASCLGYYWNNGPCTGVTDFLVLLIPDKGTMQSSPLTWDLHKEAILTVWPHTQYSYTKSQRTSN
jgi:hypothetical protein